MGGVDQRDDDAVGEAEIKIKSDDSEDLEIGSIQPQKKVKSEPKKRAKRVEQVVDDTVVVDADGAFNLFASAITVD